MVSLSYVQVCKCDVVGDGMSCVGVDVISGTYSTDTDAHQLSHRKSHLRVRVRVTVRVRDRVRS